MLKTLADCMCFDGTRSQSCFLQKLYVVPNVGTCNHSFSLAHEKHLCFQETSETHMVV